MAQLSFARSGQVRSDNYFRLGYERLTWGVYRRTPDVDGLDKWECRHRQFLARVEGILAVCAHPGVTLFGPTALQVMRVALPKTVEDWTRVHLLFPPGVSRVVRKDVVPHRCTYTPQVLHWAGRFPILHPIEHWLQIRGATDDEMIEIGDGFLRRRKPLLTCEQMESMVSSLQGRTGAKQVTRVLKWVRPGTDSLPETRTRMLLVRAGLPEPSVNLPVPCSSLKYPYHLDLGYLKEKVGVEYDGLVHVSNQTQMEIDITRRRHLLDEGWTVMSVTAKDLHPHADFIRSVDAALYTRRPR